MPPTQFSPQRLEQFLPNHPDAHASKGRNWSPDFHLYEGLLHIIIPVIQQQYQTKYFLYS
jgi:hypothetical protein